MSRRDVQGKLFTPSGENNYFKEIGELDYKELITGLQDAIIRKSIMVYGLEKERREKEDVSRATAQTLLKLLNSRDFDIFTLKRHNAERTSVVRQSWKAFAYELIYDREGNVEAFVLDLDLSESGKAPELIPVEFTREIYAQRGEFEGEVFDSLLEGINILDRESLTEE